MVIKDICHKCNPKSGNNQDIAREAGGIEIILNALKKHNDIDTCRIGCLAIGSMVDNNGK